MYLYRLISLPTIASALNPPHILSLIYIPSPNTPIPKTLKLKIGDIQILNNNILIKLKMRISVMVMKMMMDDFVCCWLYLLKTHKCVTVCMIFFFFLFLVFHLCIWYIYMIPFFLLWRFSYFLTLIFIYDLHYDFLCFSQILVEIQRLGFEKRKKSTISTRSCLTKIRSSNLCRMVWFWIVVRSKSVAEMFNPIALIQVTGERHIWAEPTCEHL